MNERCKHIYTKGVKCGDQCSKKPHNGAYCYRHRGIDHSKVVAVINHNALEDEFTLRLPNRILSVKRDINDNKHDDNNNQVVEVPKSDFNKLYRELNWELARLKYKLP